MFSDGIPKRCQESFPLNLLPLNPAIARVCELRPSVYSTARTTPTQGAHDGMKNALSNIEERLQHAKHASFQALAA